MTRAAELRRCPSCGQRWPDDADYSLRALGFLHGLPRNIGPSNIDAVIHDGSNPNRGHRFLVYETKGPKEALELGQERLLMALAAQPGFYVRILRGTRDSMVVQEVEPSGVRPPRGEPIDGEELNRRVAAFLGGAVQEGPKGEVGHEPPSTS